MGDHEIVLFDLDGVERITSFGVREWRTTLSQLRSQYLGFVHCHPSLVSQFNLVPGFACGGELISFYLPYICPSCNHVAEELLDLRGENDNVESLTAPDVQCPACGAMMEFDDIPAAYFKYARSVARPRPPAAASAMIDGRVEDSPRRELSVKKEVEDTVTAFWLSGALDDKRALRRLSEGIEGHVVVVLAEVDALTDDGLIGLAAFLRAAGKAYLCRVPQALIVPIVECLEREGLADARIVSVSLAVPCAQCASPVEMELDGARLEAFLDGTHTPFEKCPACGAHLDARTIAQPVRDALAKTQLVDPPEAVQVYLQNRSGAPGVPGGAMTYTAPSQLLFGNYRILRRLGEGGMGEVLLARFVGAEEFEKLVVLKRIRRDYLKNPEAMKQFQQEARVTARLSHPNIVQVFDFSRIDEEFFFAMEYVNGIDLRQALRLCSDNKMYWPPELCMRVISDVCSGLQAAHEYTDESGAPVPIYHRDVSPENVIISVDGAVKLTDFGIAKAADSSVNTDSGVFKGKHSYTAPEQLEEGVTTDHRTDIYATGIVLFELLSLRRYYGDEPSLPMVYASSMRPPPKLSHERDGIPAGLQPIFERAVASDRSARYQSAFELKQSLEQLMKRGEYPTNHDLAVWIRTVMTLERSSGDDDSADSIDRDIITAVEARGTPNAADDDG
jgi:serine/threonine protein kinase